MTTTKISKAYKTTISAEAVRLLRLRPGMRVNQFVEGNRLVLEPVEDVDSLAGSLSGRQRSRSVIEMKAAVRAGITKAGMGGMEERQRNSKKVSRGYDLYAS